MSEDEKTNEIVEAAMNVEFLPEFPKEEIEQGKFTEIDISSLATGGMALTSLASSLTTLAPVAGEQLYRLDLRGYAGHPAELHNEPGKYLSTIVGNAGEGIVGQGAYVPVETTNAISMLDPYMLMMAVALSGIEAQMRDIKAMSQHIIDFLEEDKKAGIRGNVNVLADIMNNYKHNIGNERYRDTRHKQVLDVRRDAEKDIEFYRARIERSIAEKKLIHVSGEVADKLKKLNVDLSNYQAALYCYGFATFLEVMLLENFEADYLRSVAKKLDCYSNAYRKLYTKASVYIEEQSDTSVRAGLLGGIAAAGKGLGQALHQVPVLEKGPVDEALFDGGKALDSLKHDLTKDDVKALAARKDSCIAPFMKNIETVYSAYHKPLQVLTDGKKLWFELGD